MGQKSILDKLVILLGSFQNNLIEEKDVIYILIEIGKFLEREDNAQNYPPLMFFRNWVAHTRKDRLGDIPDDLRRIVENGDSVEEIKAVLLMVVEELRRGINNFCSDKNLPPILENENTWDSFRDSLLLVLEEQPLSFKNYRNRVVEIRGISQAFRLVVSDENGLVLEIPL